MPIKPKAKTEPPPHVSREEAAQLAVNLIGLELRQGKTPSRTLVELLGHCPPHRPPPPPPDPSPPLAAPAAPPVPAEPA